MNINLDTLTTLARAWDDITTTPEVEECPHDRYGLWTVEYDGRTYAIGTEEEADAAAREYIKESAWAFRPEFVAQYCAGSITAEHVRRIIGDDCEDANDVVLDLLEDFDTFAAAAINGDGIGHFLSSYDGESYEITSPCGDRLVVVRVN